MPDKVIKCAISLVTALDETDLECLKSSSATKIEIKVRALLKSIIDAGYNIEDFGYRS